MKGIFKLKINGMEDRNQLVHVLTENGYKVWLKKEETTSYFKYDYYIYVQEV